MGTQVTASTIPGGITPLCNECGVALCWDLPEEEYLQDKGFWDEWRCRDCNPDYEGALQRYRAQRGTSPITRVIHLRDSKGAVEEVYIGRAGKTHDGYFGNPIAKGKKCPVCGNIHTDGGSTLPCYRIWLAQKLEGDGVFKERVKGLYGKVLVCFCKPSPCHGDVLAEVAELLVKGELAKKTNAARHPLTYAGIGSRETPPEILDTMKKIGGYLAGIGWTLRSGGALGADSAFESGCGNGPKEIYLPWKGFQNNPSPLYHIPPKAFEIAKDLHPAWEKLSQAVQKLMARNVCQILGQTLDKKADFVVCWTKDGKASGGTGQAIRLAEKYEITVFNLHDPESLSLLRQLIKATRIVKSCR